MRAPSLLPVALAAAMLTAPALAAPAGPERNLAVRPVAPAAGAASPSALVAGPRVALVVGNAAYADAPLANPVNDARAMARALSAAGFDVLLHTDADLRTLATALREFGERLAGGGTGLFYFAGHGMQIKGRNYLVPVGSDIRREDEVPYQSLDVQAVLDKMESAGNGTNIVVLDACRNNPFARSFRSAAQGLAPLDAPVGTLVAFATSPGSVASDGIGDNGLYTRHLLAAMAEPGRKVEEVFKQVRTAVRRDSGGQQIPWESTSLEGDFYFVPPQPVQAVAPPTPAPPLPDALTALDDALWQAVQGTRVAAELQAYLNRFPAGRHAAAARQRLTALASATAPAPAAPTASIGITLPTVARPLAQLPGAEASAPLALPLVPTDGAAVPALASLASPVTLAAAPMPSAPSPSPSPLPAAATAAASPVHAPPPDTGPAPGAPPAPLDHIAATMLAAPSGRWGRDTTADAELHRLLAAAPPAAAEPAAPAPRNLYGFQAGDRYRFRQIDRLTDRILGFTHWEIDRFDDDGGIVINGGAVRLTARGVPIFENDALRGTWTEWRPPLPLVYDGLAPGQKRDVTGLRRSRGVDGRTATSRFEGTLRVVRHEVVQVPAGRFDTLRLELRLRGDTERDDGTNQMLWWKLTLWWAPALGVWAATELDERVDAQLGQLLRTELVSFERPRDDATAAARR